MLTVYVYVPDTLADWELGYVTAELRSGRFYKEGAPQVALRTAGAAKEPIQTMGGLTVTPDLTVADIAIDPANVLLLPGANTWSDPAHGAVIRKAAELMQAGGTVCAICGATVALANAGLLDARPHTSNGPGFLDMFVPGYKGQRFYINEPSVADGGLITAACTGALLWAKQIIERVGVFSAETLEAWYRYFSTGDPQAYFALMQSLPAAAQG